MLSLLIVCGTIGLAASQVEPCENVVGLEQRGDFCFYWSNAAGSSIPLENFFESNLRCSRFGGTLASFNRIQDSEWAGIRHGIGSRRNNDYWLGGTNEPYRNLTFYWFDGSFWDPIIAEQHWSFDEPQLRPDRNSSCIALASNYSETGLGLWETRECYDVDIHFICKVPRRQVCDCQENESKFCDTGFECTSFRVCEAGHVINVQCNDGEVADRVTASCKNESEAMAPCGLMRDCAGRGNSSVPIYESLCHNYYRCQNDTWTGQDECPEGEVFDILRQDCEDASEVCEPCGHSDEDPSGNPCPAPTHNMPHY